MIRHDVNIAWNERVVRRARNIYIAAAAATDCDRATLEELVDEWERVMPCVREVFIADAIAREGAVGSLGL